MLPDLYEEQEAQDDTEIHPNDIRDSIYDEEGNREDAEDRWHDASGYTPPSSPARNSAADKVKTILNKRSRMKLIRNIRKSKRSMRRIVGREEAAAMNDEDSCCLGNDDGHEDALREGEGMDEDMREVLYPGSTRARARPRPRPNSSNNSSSSSSDMDRGPSTSSRPPRKRAKTTSATATALSDDESGETDTDTEQRRLFKRNEKNIVAVIRDRLGDLLPTERREQEEFVSVLADALINKCNRPKNAPFPSVRDAIAESGAFAKELQKSLKPPEPAVISGAWDPCMAPDIFELYETLGYPSPQEKCWACNKDPENTVRSNTDAWECLTTMYRDNVNRMSKVQLAVQLYTYFEENIRKPANANLQPGQRPIPEWRKVDVFMHMYRHTNEPAVRINNILSQLTRMMDDLHDYGMYERNRAHRFMARPQSKPMHDYRDLTDTWVKVSQCKPENMVGARGNSERYTKSTAYHFINPDKPGYGGRGSHPSMLVKSIM